MKPESSGTPLIDLIMRGIGRLIPFDRANEFSAADYRTLKKRHGKLDGFSQAVAMVGVVGGAFLPRMLREKPVRFTGWDLGLEVGLCVALPVAFVLVVSAIKGHGRLHEFLVFYSLKYGMDARKLFRFIYAPLILLGAVSAYFAYFSA